MSTTKAKLLFNFLKWNHSIHLLGTA